VAPPFPARTPAPDFQPPYFPPPFTTASHMLQPHSVQAEVFSSAMQPLHSADPYQVTSSLQHFQAQQVCRVLGLGLQLDWTWTRLD
jgi:hypothetical protein